ncbi:helix-turn-helix domain-containing protein [uncultured Croceitalea sp.]|uniref:helix-turn-helix domain-containing protein n=1 Tax=uncultured Croceitalea sp. TaxID=1798908 RepID=UPI003305DF87
MDFQNQLLFLFSALGAINGLVLSIYFAFFTKQNQPSNYFLAALLFVLSIRILKSVFFYFNRDLSQTFIQVGISACVLIGPCLYLYIRSFTKSSMSIKKSWPYHIVPFLLITTVVWFFLPYWHNRKLWSTYLIRIIYLQWFAYILLSGFYLKGTFKKLFKKNRKLVDSEIFLLSVYLGVTVIWVAYFTVRYTSYIAGALSFSFVFYLLLLLWFFKRKRSSFFEKHTSYANKKISDEEAGVIAKQLDLVMSTKQLYRNPNLKLSDVAQELNISTHFLSQYLNDNMDKGFPLFLNEYRVKEAKQRLIESEHLTLAAIGEECGFKSNSTFYAAFKKITGLTPAKFKKQLI